MKEGITLKQTDEAKLERSREILEALKEARGGKLLDSHRVMGNDPNLINMFYQQYVNCNTIDEIFEVIRILFITSGETKQLPALETLGDLIEAIDLEEK